MTNNLQPALKRATFTLIIAMLGIGLLATGVWAGSGQHRSERSSIGQARDSFWAYDLRTGNPMGPAGQPDFWNYDPMTGAKSSDFSPGVAPNELAALWGVER